MRYVRLILAYTTDNERCVERHKCASQEEAAYVVNLTRQLAPLDLQADAKWVEE